MRALPPSRSPFSFVSLTLPPSFVFVRCCCCSLTREHDLQYRILKAQAEEEKAKKLKEMMDARLRGEPEAE